MDVQLERSEIIKRLKKVDDESLITAFKDLLDNALDSDELLEASIDRGCVQSEKNEVRPHKEVMAELKEHLSYSKSRFYPR